MTRYALWSAVCAVATALSLTGAWLLQSPAPLVLMVPVVAGAAHLWQPWRVPVSLMTVGLTVLGALYLAGPATALWLLLALVVAHLFGSDSRALVDEMHDEVAAAVGRVQEVVVVDPVTGALNRMGLDLVAPPIVAAARRRGDAVFAARVEVGGLEAFTEQEGELAADLLIKEVAETLRLAVRASDLVARTGHDVFHIVGPGRGATSQALRSRCEALMLHRHDPVLATWPGQMQTFATVLPPWDDFTDLDSLLQRADAVREQPVA